jgi:DNA-binding MarR family transcriptional regulator
MINVSTDAVDRRRLVVRLSEKGNEEIRRLQAAALEAETDLLDRLGPDERAQLRTVVSDLYARG